METSNKQLGTDLNIGALKTSQRSIATKQMTNRGNTIFKAEGNFMAFYLLLPHPLPSVVQHAWKALA